MKFGQIEIPQQLFDVARSYASSLSSFRPDDIRQHLLDNFKVELNSISTIESNHWIIANRVTRKIITDLSRQGALHKLKLGLWSKPENNVKSDESAGPCASTVAALEAENADLLKCLRDIINACDRCGKADELSLIDEFSEEMEQAARDAIARADARRVAKP